MLRGKGVVPEFFGPAPVHPERRGEASTLWKALVDREAE
jgi:hypothetical protein